MPSPISDLDPVRHRPTRAQVLMRQAEIVAERSTCSRAQVGVVIVHEARVVSQGYNGAPAGMPHCDHACNCGGRGPKPECICPPSSSPMHPITRGPHWDSCKARINVWKLDDPHLNTCPAAVVGCQIAVHAEANAIAFAAKHGVATNGADLFTTLAPCLVCAQLIINAGIVHVTYASSYRYEDGLTLLMSAGIPVVKAE
jgi:dCMP deaminase